MEKCERCGTVIAKNSTLGLCPACVRDLAEETRKVIADAIEHGAVDLYYVRGY